MNIDHVQKGMKVWWTDPDPDPDFGISSGIYTVTGINGDIVTIENVHGSLVEVFSNEIKPL